ncbi:MAG: radical SAM protein [Promethearchaeota archaeon]
MYKAPIKVTVDITNRCNLACIHCYGGELFGRSPAKDELTTNEFKKLIDRLASLGVAALPISGGEPLLRSDLLAILEYAREKGLIVTVATNAIIVSSSTARRLGKLTKVVSVSLDGATPEIHDRIRGVKGAFKAAIKGIETLLDAGCYVVIIATLMKQNYESFLDTIDLSIKLGVQEFSAHRCSPSGRAAQNYQEIILNGAAVSELLKEIKNQGENMQGETEIGVSMPAYETLTNDPLTRGCPAGEISCSIGATGHVFPCPHFHSYLEMSAGNIREKDFADIWFDSPLLNSFRNVKATMLKGKCASCERKEVCLGGCKAAAYAVFGDMFAGDPQCPYSTAT